MFSMMYITVQITIMQIFLYHGHIKMTKSGDSKPCIYMLYYIEITHFALLCTFVGYSMIIRDLFFFLKFTLTT
jgi:hypothetical protein